MSTNYPGALDTLSNPSASSATNSPSHAAQHADANDAIEAIEAKLGTGATTPTANKLLFGTGTGTTAWQGLTSAQLLAILSDETGTGSAVFATTPTLVTPKVDTINESTPTNGVTIDGLNIKDSALNTNNSVVTSNITALNVTTAKIAANAVDYTKVAAGFLVQVVSTQTSAMTTGATLIPSDDTIPQNTEGDQYMSLSVTPKATTNNLVIQTVWFGSHSVIGDEAIALFQDTTANALAVTKHRIYANTGALTLYLTHTMAAGTTSATTFKIRAGNNTAGTTTFNGVAGGRLYGGTAASSIVIWEYTA